MGIPVKLEVFEGPLDLLLHLIEKNKVDIYDIPIVLITEQYLDYVQQMEKANMDIMSEFLVMAATLVKINKYASFELKDRQVDAGRVFYKKETLPDEVKNFTEDVPISDLLNDITLAKLQGIFNSVMKKQVDKIDPIRSKFGEIEKEEISLEDHIVFLENYANVIVTFLGILEMMKMGKLTIVQKEIFDDIMITYREESEEKS